jgi:1-pyrroline-5-carboxylate dehydrogenase
MSNFILSLPAPYNEPIKAYLPKSTEREALAAELERQMGKKIEIGLIINGRQVNTTQTVDVICPHDHGHQLATCAQADDAQVRAAIDAALAAKPAWESMPWPERASIFLKAADLVSQKYSAMLNAATMLGQSKNVFQAEIDATCELADFLRFSVKQMEQIYQLQPHSDKGTWNRTEYRPLEGFVFALTPFNFTAIAGNLCAAPALMGNTVVWKPATTAVLSGYYLMQIFKEAGLPDGVINFVPGKGAMIGDIVLKHQHLGGIHFTGSTKVFQTLWRKVGSHIEQYRSYPRIVGETGGKDYIFVHPTAGVDEVVTAAVRGAFEYQGQKCSAASRMYVPKSLWPQIRSELIRRTQTLKTGPVTDFSCFLNAVIDEASYEKATGFIDRAKTSDKAEIIAGGDADRTTGFFIYPTIIQALDPFYESMTEEIFAPILSIYVYADDALDTTLDIVDQTSLYALTGAVFAGDRAAIAHMMKKLTHSAGNFYINDKPTGAVVGQQPFGGSRGSGTNDKAGSMLNLLRWTSARTIKENFLPPRSHEYPFMAES